MMMTDTPAPHGDAPTTLSQPQVEDVFAATEEVRAAGFPSVPAELLTAVLAAEQENLDNRTAAQRAVARAVDDWLAGHPGEPAQAAHAGESGPGEGNL
jgi:hypothetical protein